MNKVKLKESIIKAGIGLWNALPILIGVILLISLINVLVPKSAFIYIFRDNYIIDPIIGSALGSILAGNAITSYILGGKLLSQGVSLLAVTAFIVAWVTVGLIQLPAESMLLGKKFAIIRNITAFVFSIIVAILTILVVNLL